MNPLCAQCYKRDAQNSCTRCGCRYCSRGCQVAHWKDSHKAWCGKAGQWGQDYEIRPSPDKQGLGVFALRHFKKYETISVERLLRVGPNMDIPTLTDDRLPSGFAGRHDYMLASGKAMLVAKANEVCLITGRTNSDCLGNARAMVSGRVQLMKAVRDIACGEEICIPLIDVMDIDRFVDFSGCKRGNVPFVDRKKRQKVFKEQEGFRCKCRACTKPAVDRKLGKLHVLFKEHDVVSDQPDIAKIKHNAEKMVALADELGCSPHVYYHIYSKLQCATAIAACQSDKEDMKAVLVKKKMMEVVAAMKEDMDAVAVKEDAMGAKKDEMDAVAENNDDAMEAVAENIAEMAVVEAKEEAMKALAVKKEDMEPVAVKEDAIGVKKNGMDAVAAKDDAVEAVAENMVEIAVVDVKEEAMKALAVKKEDMEPVAVKEDAIGVKKNGMDAVAAKDDAVEAVAANMEGMASVVDAMGVKKNGMDAVAAKDDAVEAVAENMVEIAVVDVKEQAMKALAAKRVEELEMLSAKIKEITTKWYEPDSKEAMFGQVLASTSTGETVVLAPVLLE